MLRSKEEAAKQKDGSSSQPPLPPTTSIKFKGAADAAAPSAQSATPSGDLRLISIAELAQHSTK